METPSFLFAFGAGLLAFLSPCVLPVVPGYLAFLTGMGPAELESGERRSQVVSHAVAFLAGFSLIFLALGALAGVITNLLVQYADPIRWIGGLAIILFGLSTLGIMPIGFLKREARVQVSKKPAGYLGSALVGFAFAAGWTPCMGPILASVLLIASQNPSSGLWLLAAYVVGFSLPFLASALWLGSFRPLRKYLGTLERVGGVVMILTGVLLATNIFAVISRYFVSLTGFQGF